MYFLSYSHTFSSRDLILLRYEILFFCSHGSRENYQCAVLRCQSWMDTKERMFSPIYFTAKSIPDDRGSLNYVSRLAKKSPLAATFLSSRALCLHVLTVNQWYYTCSPPTQMKQDNLHVSLCKTRLYIQKRSLFSSLDVQYFINIFRRIFRV